MAAAVSNSAAADPDAKWRRKRLDSGLPDVERSSLHRALDEGRFQSVLYQVKLGMDPNVRSRHGLTPLMRCAQVRPPSASMQLIRTLLDRGANPDLTDSTGNNLLQVAVRESNTALVQLLLTENNVNFHHRNANGDTVLHLLANQSANMCRMVLRAARRFHIDCDQGNADGVTPMMAACRAGNLPVVELFARAGGASLTKRDTKQKRTAQDWLKNSLRGGSSSDLVDQQWLLRLKHPETTTEDPYQQVRESRRLETLSRLFQKSGGASAGQEQNPEDYPDEEDQGQAVAESQLPPVAMVRSVSVVVHQNDCNRSRSSRSSFRRGITADSRISQARLISGIFGVYEWQLTDSFRRPAVPLPSAAMASILADGGEYRLGSRPHSRLSSGRSQRSPVNNLSGNVGGNIMARRMTEFAGGGMRLKQRIRSGAQRLSEAGTMATSDISGSALLLNTSQDSGGLRRLSSRI